METVILGSGNVATVLGKKICAAGHTVVQVLGRNQQRTGKLAAALNSKAVYNVTDITKDAGCYIIAVSDAAVEPLARQLKLRDGMLVHTAGSVSMQVLSDSSNLYGVLYPLQSMRMEMDRIPPMPLLIDANNAKAIEQLRAFASSLSDRVVEANDDYRLKLHLSAVVVNNFVNHLYVLAEDYCRKEGLDFRLLLPLIADTAIRLDHCSPAKVQTGPAVRSDTATIDMHLQLLKAHPQLSVIYRLFSESIAQSVSENPTA